MTEVFKIHKSGYLVSNKGRIKGVRIPYLNPVKNNCGYLVTSLPNNNGRSWATLHRVVYETFNGDIPEGRVINHIDGDKTNNTLTNLECITSSENAQHAYDNGLANGKAGETNSQAKLTAEQFIEVCELLMEGCTNSEIADLYNLHDRYVSLIRHKKRWKGLFPSWYTPTKSLGNTGITLPKMIQIYEDCLSLSKNKDIAEKWDIDRSTVSRIRSNKTWIDFIEYYNSNIVELQRPSSAEEYTQVGGNIENPI
ncbi:MAG: HNH endonuclease signature motif containing protein [Thiomicrorhabdus sp.]|jgi:hypothetical protein|nr:HNH endonuclease signature motif containing protein [Thiomicrorhabdus sp.]